MSTLYAKYRAGVIVAVHQEDQGEGEATTPITTDHADYVAFLATLAANALAGRTCTPLQMRRALRQLGILATVESYVASQSEETQEAWEYASAMPASDPLIVAACAALSVDRKALYDLAETL